MKITIKPLPWRTNIGEITAHPFVIECNRMKLPYYRLKSTIVDSVEMFQPSFYYYSNGCCDCGSNLSVDFIELEKAKLICQEHFQQVILKPLLHIDEES